MVKDENIKSKMAEFILKKFESENLELGDALFVLSRLMISSCKVSRVSDDKFAEFLNSIMFEYKRWKDLPID